ncbi:MAG: type IV toxin-antitoxin system AbiEi family antitoxin [Gammaproteobacteria bacterium]
MEKNQILQEGLKQLNDYARVSLTPEVSGDMFELASHSVENYDAVAINSSNNPEISYTGLVQPWAPQKDINALITQLKLMPSGAILFANFVNPVMAEKFRRRSISFVDCAGNLSIKTRQFDFYVKGKRLPQLRARRVRGRAFNSAGLKLIFAVFNQPELLQATYREISTKVNVALGSVGPVIEDLFTSGYILDDGQRRLVNKKRLFERWVDGYLEKLRPKQILCCYSSDNADWWKQAAPERFDGLWGGDVIIAKSTPFMVPETISLYFSSADKQNEFAGHYGLQRDDEGDICVYKTFWPDTANRDDGISPMVMYADIVDSINPGSWDVAKTFYGEAVAHLLDS